MGTACHIRTQATIKGSQDPYDNQNEEQPIVMYTIAGRSNALYGYRRNFENIQGFIGKLKLTNFAHNLGGDFFITAPGERIGTQRIEGY